MNVMSEISAWLATTVGASAKLGFYAYLLWTVWFRMSSRWDRWLPFVAKAARICLYIWAVVVLVQALEVFSADAYSPAMLIAGMLGAALVPLGQKLVRLVRRTEHVRRGEELISAPQLAREVRKEHSRKDIQQTFNIGGVPLPRSFEPYHLLISGATGTGKSVAFAALLDLLEARGDTVLVVDSGGGFCARSYKPGRDFILNPFDARCVPWSPVAELQGPWDAEALARSIVPDGVGEDKSWNGYAQKLIMAILRKLHDQKQLSTKNLLFWGQVATMEQLKGFLAGTAAAGMLNNERTFGSIQTIMTAHLSAYNYLVDASEPFSIAKFIQRDKPGTLYLTYRDDQLDSLSALIGCALDVAARTILSLRPNSERRVWLVIDEFASIGKVQSIEAISTKARKNGGCLAIGIQSISQLKDRYGDNGALTILGNLSTWLVLRTPDPDLAEYLSRYIGETELSRMTRGESQSVGGNTDSLNEQILTQRLVMPVQIQKLPDLTGFMRLKGAHSVCKFKLRFPKRREEAQALEMRDFEAHPMLELAPPEGVAEVASVGASATAPGLTASVVREEPTNSRRQGAGEDDLLPEAFLKEAGLPSRASGSAQNVAASLAERIPPGVFEAGPAALESALYDLVDSMTHTR